jgi:hypothetical protein
MRLGYASEAESRVDRINRKLHKLEAKLGEEGQAKMNAVADVRADL